MNVHYRNYYIRTIGGYNSRRVFQVFGPKLRNGGRAWVSDHSSLAAAKGSIDGLRILDKRAQEDSRKRDNEL